MDLNKVFYVFLMFSRRIWPAIYREDHIQAGIKDMAVSRHGFGKHPLLHT